MGSKKNLGYFGMGSPVEQDSLNGMQNQIVQRRGEADAIRAQQEALWAANRDAIRKRLANGTGAPQVFNPFDFQIPAGQGMDFMSKMKQDLEKVNSLSQNRQVIYNPFI